MNPVKRRKIEKRKIYFNKIKENNFLKKQEEVQVTLPVVEEVVQEEILSTVKEETFVNNEISAPTIEDVEAVVAKEKTESKKKKKNSEFTN